MKVALPGPPFPTVSARFLARKELANPSVTCTMEVPGVGDGTVNTNPGSVNPTVWTGFDTDTARLPEMAMVICTATGVEGPSAEASTRRLVKRNVRVPRPGGSNGTPRNTTTFVA